MRMQTVNPPRNPVTQVQAAINMEKTGEQLKTITKEKGYEVRDLMTLTGYSSQAVYKWFNGRSLPSIDTLVVLSKALNMEIMELLVIDGEFIFFATAGLMQSHSTFCTIDWFRIARAEKRLSGKKNACSGT